MSTRTAPPGTTPGNYTLFDTLLHPREHFLDTFTNLPLTAALAPLPAAAPKCTESAPKKSV
jgi:hypothetical protein